MSLDANRADLKRHARDFAERTGFTFTVLRPGTEEVIGCVYIYPARDGGGDAHVRSWVRADVAELDGPLHAAVSRWLVERWPFERAIYAGRPDAWAAPKHGQWNSTPALRSAAGGRCTTSTIASDAAAARAQS